MNMVTKTLSHILLVCLALSLMVGCASSPTPPPSDTSLGPADRVDVVYFHRTQRCPRCIHAEESINYTVETYFADELASGKVTFQVVNLQDEENAAIVNKYRAYTSSLFINTIRDGTDHIEEVTYIWLLLDDHEAFVEAVRSKIEKSLKGEE
jgi:thiol-disulfide isomerase/thioredoxin